MNQLRKALEGLKVSKSKAHEPRVEEDGKTKTMEWISGCSEGEVWKESSMTFLSQWRRSIAQVV